MADTSFGVKDSEGGGSSELMDVKMVTWVRPSIYALAPPLSNAAQWHQTKVQRIA
jgi:hypothetical protein